MPWWWEGESAMKEECAGAFWAEERANFKHYQGLDNCLHKASKVTTIMTLIPCSIITSTRIIPNISLLRRLLLSSSQYMKPSCVHRPHRPHTSNFHPFKMAPTIVLSPSGSLKRRQPHDNCDRQEDGKNEVNAHPARKKSSFNLHAQCRILKW